MKPALALLLPCALLIAACGSVEDRRLRHATSHLMEAPMTGLNGPERAEAAWLMALADPGAVMRARAASTRLDQAQNADQAFGTVRAGAALGARRATELFEALYDFDARSYFSEVNPRRPLYLTEGAAFRAALDSLGREDMQARLQAAEQALAAARRWKEMGPGVARRARGGALAPRAALLAAMASAADADSRAIRQSAFGANAYTGHLLRRNREIADEIAAISTELWGHHAPLADAARQERARRGANARPGGPTGPLRASG